MGIGQWHWALGMGIGDLQINMQIATKRRDDCGLWTVDFYKTPINKQCQSAIVNKWTKLQLFPIVISVKGKSKYDII